MVWLQIALHPFLPVLDISCLWFGWDFWPWHVSHIRTSPQTMSQVSSLGTICQRWSSGVGRGCMAFPLPIPLSGFAPERLSHSQRANCCMRRLLL